MRIEHDIFDLIGGGERYHSAILTCFSFDPIFFSSFYLPNLRAAGMRNIMVLVDSSNYDAAMEGFSEYGALVQDMKCHLVRMTPTSKGVFHPKVVLLFGKKDALVAVGSGNLTYSGYLRNDELWGAFQINGSSSHNYPILKQVWQYINGIVPKNEVIECQFSWIKANCPCVEVAEQTTETFSSISDGSRAVFVGNTESGSIGRQINQTLSNEYVKQIKILSPFYDGDRLVGILQDTFGPETIHLIYDSSSPMLPAKVRDNWKTYSWNHDNRRLHGKAFQIECEDKTVFLLGSANATLAAWGTEDSYINDEACLLLTSDSKRDFFSELGIDLTIETEVVNNGKAGFPNDDTTKDRHLCHILSCIANQDGSLLLELDADISGVELAGLDNICKEIASIPVGSKDHTICTDLEGLTRAKLVVLTKDGKAVSNRCLVLSIQVLQNMNPSDLNRKLDILLESTPDWQGHIEEILSYGGYHSLRWDEVSKPTSHGSKASRSSYSAKDEDKTVTREDLDHVMVNVGFPPHVAANIKVADFLNANLKGSSLNLDDSDSAENITQKDIDAGIEPSGDNNAAVPSPARVADIYDSLVRYCKKTSQSYEKAIAAMTYNAVGIPEEFQYEPTIEDYSILATLSICSFYCQVHSEGKPFFDWNPFIISSLSRFLVLFKKGPAEQNGYAYRKSMEFLHDSIIYFLLILSSRRWFKISDMVSLLLMNIMDSLPEEGMASRERILEDYLKKIDKKELAYISECVNEIKVLFTTGPAITEEVIDLKERCDNYLTYKKAIGYCYLDTGSKRYVNKDGHQEDAGFHASLRHPGVNTLQIETGKRLKIRKFCEAQ